MENNVYAKAYSEVLEIIKYIPKNEFLKIPKEKILFFETYKDKNYDFKIDPKISLEKQNISEEANAIIIILYRDYFATESQKIKLQEILNHKKVIQEQEKRERYNPNELFKNSVEIENKSNIVDQNTEMSIYKESFWNKIKEYIMKLIKI